MLKFKILYTSFRNFTLMLFLLFGISSITNTTCSPMGTDPIQTQINRMQNISATINKLRHKGKEPASNLIYEWASQITTAIDVSWQYVEIYDVFHLDNAIKTACKRMSLYKPNAFWISFKTIKTY